MIRWIIFVVIYILLGVYNFQAIKNSTKNQWIYILYGIIILAVLINFIWQFHNFNRGGFKISQGYAIGFLLAILVPQFVVTAFLLLEDLIRLPQAAYRFFTEGASITNKGFIYPSRRAFVSKIALGLAAIPFASLLYGMYKGKYNFKVLSYNLYFDDLPDAFDGYKITQISDIHSGSFDNKEKVEYAVDLVNEQASDLILFTGDLVNNLASEMKPWKDTFGKLKAKDGVFSVLGNHDYGDYVVWDSKEAKQHNLNALIEIQREMGFKLLLNDADFITRGNDRLAIIGVENWGKGFKQKGDLKKASAKVSNSDFKILMSHDPSHWEAEVLPSEMHYHLTLSGHTHGMQFGIEIPGWFKWSPVKWRYKQWAGIYEQQKRILNVNRGFGYLAYPGRVGIWPEITTITLKKGRKPI